MGKSYIKPKKAKKRLEIRQKHFETNTVIQNAIRRYPGCYTKPGSFNK